MKVQGLHLVVLCFCLGMVPACAKQASSDVALRILESR